MSRRSQAGTRTWTERIAGGLAVIGLILAPMAGSAETAEETSARYGSYVFDVAILRTAAVGQLVVGSVVALVAWPLSLGSGQSDDVLQRCVTTPFEDAFERPMGDF